MLRTIRALCVLLVVVLLGGCASAYSRGETALLQGRYQEAVGHFQDALARDQSTLGALVGLGIAKYKLGAVDEAVDSLRRVVGQAPDNMEARFYLGLGYLRKNENGLAEEQLQAFVSLKPDPRLATLVDRTLVLLRAEPVTEGMRSFVILSLENEALWAQDVRALNRELEYARRPVFTPCAPEVILVPVR